MIEINTIYDLVQTLRGRLYSRFEEEVVGQQIPGMNWDSRYVMRVVDEEITALYTQLAENIRIPGSRGDE